MVFSRDGTLERAACHCYQAMWTFEVAIFVSAVSVSVCLSRSVTWKTKGKRDNQLKMCRPFQNDKYYNSVWSKAKTCEIIMKNADLST